MYFNILKKDLKKKKTMNIILFLFAVLASMFVASGLSNVVTTMNGTDYYLKKADIGDYQLITMRGDGGVQDILDASENVESYRMENTLYLSDKNITLGSAIARTGNNNTVTLLHSVSKNGLHYFLPDNTELTHIDKGQIYVQAGWLDVNNVKCGDKIKISLGSTEMEFTIVGEMKDAFFGSEMMGNSRYLINEEDYEVFLEDEEAEPYKGCIFYIDSNDTAALSSEISQASNISYDGTSYVIKTSYIMELIVAMMMLVLSICLIIVSFVILRFVITFSIQEEYREIGVMKAIGIKNRKIRSLYMVKYVFMAVLGGIIGFVLSFPFGNMLLMSVSKKMVLGNDSGILLNVIGALSVILLMSLFTYLCTGRVKKSTPVDAIRSGQTGERYRKKTVYPLYRAHTRGALYMAFNDVISAPKRFMTIILTFFLCSIFVLGVVMVRDTMNSKNLIKTFGREADVYITDSKLVKMEFIREGGEEEVRENYEKIEKVLADNGMPGKVSMEVWYKYRFEVRGEPYTVTFQQNTEYSAAEYEYTKGSPIMNEDEIAITPAIEKRFGIKTGDVITIDFGNEKRDCMVVGYFQTMNQMGEIIRLHEAAPTSMKYANAMTSFQIDFYDNPDDKEIKKRIEWLKDYYGVEKIFDAAGFCRDCIGVTETMEDVSFLLLVITCIVVIMVTVLMERSFIFDETGEIALLKAIGFKDGTILKWHMYRFMLVGLISEVLAAAFTMPVTKLWCDPIWSMMGATNVRYRFEPLSILLIYPGVILASTLAAIGFTAVYTKKIKSRDIVNIE